jgi:hypothetical protein
MTDLEVWGILRGASDRKHRLAVCACCRLIWDLLDDERCRRSVEAAEQFADGLLDGQRLGKAHAAAWPVITTAREPIFYPAQAAAAASAPNPPLIGAGCAIRAQARLQSPRPLPEVVLREVVPPFMGRIRDVLGDPSCPAAFDPRWLASNDGAVWRIARTCYEGRSLPGGELDNACLAILSDALEDAGCEGDLLDHLRSDGPHVRGCWAVDLVLGRG